MTGLDNFAVQQAITEYLQSVIPFSVSTGAFPTVDSLPFVDGHLVPYVILRFGDLLPRSGDTSFVGPTNDGYYSLFDALVVAETDVTARELSSKITRNTLGLVVDNAGAVRKGFGGGSFAILDSNKNPVAFIATASFQYPTNLQDVGNVGT